MDKTVSVGLFVCGCLVWLACVKGQVTEPCLRQIDSCTCQTATGYVNLHPLDQASIDGTPYIIDSTSRQSYSYNPCSEFSMVSCHNVSACQMDAAGVTYALGAQNSAQFINVVNNTGNMIQYKYASLDGNRILEVHLVCDYVKGTLEFLGENPMQTYKMKLTTKYACADFAPDPSHNATTPTVSTSPGVTTPKPGCDCDGETDFTFILIAVVVATFCLCVLMLVAGVLVMLLRRQGQTVTTSGQGGTTNQYQKL